MNKILLIAALPLLFLFGACKKDNFDPPGSMLSGRLVYKGEPLPMNGNSADSYILQLYQPGFQKLDPSIGVRVSDGGVFTSNLFDGTYKLLPTTKNTFPFIWEDWPKKANGSLDSLTVTMAGAKTLDLKVTPFFEINDIKYEVKGIYMYATFTIKRVTNDANVKNAYVYLNTNELVNKGTTYRKAVAVTSIAQPITVKIPISEYRSSYVNNTQGVRDYAFIRVAVETDKATEYLWSKVQKIDSLPTINDVTKTYFKNAGPVFQTLAGAPNTGDIITTPADWIVTDNVKNWDNGWGGLEKRWGRNAIGGSLFKPGSLLNGKIYQTFTLPAGTYDFSVGMVGHHETWNGRDNEGFLVVSSGNTLSDFQQLNDNSKTIVAADLNGFKNTGVSFTLTKETTVSLGMLFNFTDINGRAGVAFYVPSVQLIQAE